MISSLQTTLSGIHDVYPYHGTFTRHGPNWMTQHVIMVTQDEWQRSG
jgi:hypothetical protein